MVRTWLSLPSPTSRLTIEFAFSIWVRPGHVRDTEAAVQRAAAEVRQGRQDRQSCQGCHGCQGCPGFQGRRHVAEVEARTMQIATSVFSRSPPWIPWKPVTRRPCGSNMRESHCTPPSRVSEERQACAVDPK